MAFPKTLRLQLGLSQAEFADLIGITAGQLSMAESGLRNLPAAALEITNALEIGVTVSKASVVSDKKLSKKISTFLNKEIRISQLKLERLRSQELKLSEKISAAKCMLALPQTTMKLANGADSEDVALHLALLQRKAAKNIEQYEAKRIRIQLAIASTEAIIVRVQELSIC